MYVFLSLYVMYFMNLLYFNCFLIEDWRWFCGMENKCEKYEFGERVDFTFWILCEMLDFTGVLGGELDENVVNFKWFI